MPPPPAASTTEERLQKILSRAGIASRRAAEELIREGHVTVNGKVITELGTKADPQRDHIRLDGRPLKLPRRNTYLVLNKPPGVVTTLSDPEGRPSVADLLVGVRDRVVPVGRLDFHSAGLLLLTNDGELAMRLSHPRYGIGKTYIAKVRGVVDSRALQRLAHGVVIDGQRTAPAEVFLIESRDDHSWIELTLHEGRNREVRRMCEAVGHPVSKLRRVRLGPIKLGKLPTGAYRELSEDEVDRLKRTVGL